MTDREPPPHPQTVHRPGTFPETGHDLVFPLEEGDEITGRVRATVSWDRIGDEDIVIHLGAFLVGQDHKVPGGNPFHTVNHDVDRSKDGSTERKGRREHGSTVRLESVTVRLDWVSEEVERVVFVAYIQDAASLKHTFGALVDGVVSVVQLPLEPDPDDADAGAQDIAQHLLDGDYHDEQTVVVVGEVFRQGSREQTWTFREIGRGHKDLIEVGAYYGVTFVHSR